MNECTWRCIANDPTNSLPWPITIKQLYGGPPFANRLLSISPLNAVICSTESHLMPTESHPFGNRKLPPCQPKSILIPTEYFDNLSCNSRCYVSLLY